VNGAYGSYNYQSPESRALSSITQDSYDYRDQGKLITKLTGDVSYLATYMRKMQQGIDAANQNVIQQLQSLINDFLVLIGGGGDTGFDFGDLKYILQAIGSLFGFGSGLSLPINLANAASHFFQEYMLGLANFDEAVNTIIDTAIATILDWFGEVPILGQAVQQLAVFITNIRDGLKNLVDNIIQAFTGIPIIGGAIGAVLTNFKNFFNGLFGQDTPKSTITSGAVPALDGSKITSGTIPTTVVPSLDASKITTGTVPAIRIGSLPTSQITSGTFGTGFIADGGITNTKLGTDISGDKIVAGTVVAARVGALDASKITTGTIGTAIVPSLDAGKITTGSFADARIPALDTSKITTGRFARGTVRGTDFSNLVEDGGFEDGGAITGSGTIVTITDPPNGGTKVLSVTSTGAILDTYVAPTSIPVAVGETYYGECYIRKTTTGVTGAVQLGFTASLGATAVSYPSIPTATLLMSAMTQNVWQKVTGIITIPAGCNNLTVRPSVRNSVPAGEIIQFDNIVVRKATAGDMVTSAIAAAYVPSLDGSKITTGTIGTAIVPSLDAGKITTGSFVDARIPSLTTSKITSGTFGSGFIADSAITNAKLGTDISGDKIVAGTVVAGHIGVLDASKITTGQFEQTFVTDLSTDLGYATDTADNATEKGLLNAADILKLQAAQNGGSNSGYSTTETFDTVSGTLNTTNWSIATAGVGTALGHIGTNGTDAYWVNGTASTNSTSLTEIDYWKTPTNGDYQLVTLIHGVPNAYGDVRLYARMDSTRLNYIMAYCTPSQIILYKVIGGVATQMGSTYSRNGIGTGTWATGDTVQLISGVGTNPRQHQVKRNNTVIIDSTTTDTTSVVGSSNRFAGFGIGVSSFSGNIYQPGKVAAWSVSDNTPPNYVGSGFRAYKSSGTNSITANNFNLLPASFYSTEEYRTDDMTYVASANNKLTVSVEGWYHVSINIGLSINTMVVDMAAALYKNGTVIKKGGSFWGGAGFVGRGPASVNGNFIVYLIAGDYIQPGYWQTTAYGASGTMSADLYSTYFEVSLINKSLL